MVRVGVIVSDRVRGLNRGTARSMESEERKKGEACVEPKVEGERKI